MRLNLILFFLSFVFFASSVHAHTFTGMVGFYDGLSFHRVINGFMAQGGCPNTREGSRGTPGTGGPGYSIDCEINSNKHVAGSLSMAHAGKNTGGSQFFLVHAPQPHLDGVHTVFGQTSDMEILLSISNGTKINNISIIK